MPPPPRKPVFPPDRTPDQLNACYWVQKWVEDSVMKAAATQAQSPKGLHTQFPLILMGVRYLTTVEGLGCTPFHTNPYI